MSDLGFQFEAIVVDVGGRGINPVEAYRRSPVSYWHPKGSGTFLATIRWWRRTTRRPDRSFPSRWARQEGCTADSAPEGGWGYAWGTENFFNFEDSWCTFAGFESWKSHWKVRPSHWPRVPVACIQAMSVAARYCSIAARLRWWSWPRRGCRKRADTERIERMSGPFHKALTVTDDCPSRGHRRSAP